MAKSNVLTIRVPGDLKERIVSVARQQGVSINQLAIYIFSKEIGNLEVKEKIARYQKGYSKEKIIDDFDEVMAKVKKREAPDWDNID